MNQFEARWMTRLIIANWQQPLLTIELQKQIDKLFEKAESNIVEMK
jgi:hypothetical protein